MRWGVDCNMQNGRLYKAERELGIEDIGLRRWVRVSFI